MDMLTTRLDAPGTRRELVSVKEAAARLGLSESDVRRRIKAGTLPAEQFDRPQGTYYRVIFETSVDASPAVNQLLTTSEHPSDMRQDTPATRQDVSPGVEAWVALVTHLTESVERQAQTIADLREERGRLQAHVEYVSARADTLAAEIEALRAVQVSVEAPGTAGSMKPTVASPEPSASWWRRWRAWLAALVLGVMAFVLALSR
jgi:excisionase family DNA binding protein